MAEAKHTAEVFHARGFLIGVELRLSPAMQHEWEARSIGATIPALDGYAGESRVMVDRATLEQIAADCRFYIDPRAVDATVGERAAYRAMLRQCEEAAE